MNGPAPASIISSLAEAPLRDASEIGLSAVGGWIVAGSEAMLGEVVKLIGLVTTPSLTASWFSGTYWRISALAMLLTTPFLFAAAVQAIIRTDLAILVRAAFVDLPIAAIGVTLAAPLITLLLAATDEMCELVTGGGPAGGAFFSATSIDLSRAGTGFLVVAIAVAILFAGLTLMVELILRSAAIYVVVLFLPLGFAAMVWPARRVWIKRMVELLVALVLSKFAMVAILSLAVAGLASLSTDPTALTTAVMAMSLLFLACASPWALLRLLPFTEIAAGASSTLRGDVRQGIRDHKDLSGLTGGALGQVAAGMLDPFSDTLRYLRRGGEDDSSSGHGRGGHDQLAPGRSGSSATTPSDTGSASGHEPLTVVDEPPQPAGVSGHSSQAAPPAQLGRGGSSPGSPAADDRPRVAAVADDGSPLPGREPTELTGSGADVERTPAVGSEVPFESEAPFLADPEHTRFNLAEGRAKEFVHIAEESTAGHGGRDVSGAEQP